MRKLIIYGLLSLTLTACGKPEIKSECSVGGRGEVTCLFKNTGKAKGSICEYVALLPKKDGMHWFKEDIQLNVLKTYIADIKKQGLSNITSNESIPSPLMLLLNTEDGVFSHTEICSGLVDAGDIRETRAYARFLFDKTPDEICNPFGSENWIDNCKFGMFSRESLAQIINKNLNQLNQAK